MKEKQYSAGGFLVVSESHQCPLWEKTPLPCRSGWSRDCFFCRYADFRTPEFQQRMEATAPNGQWYSVCRNEKNKIG